MAVFEIIITILGSGILGALLGLFYRAGQHHKEIQLRFERLENEIKEIRDNMKEMRSEIKEIRRDIAHLDKEVAVITATLRFNGFDLDRHKAEGEL